MAYLADKIQKTGFFTTLKNTILGLKKQSSVFSVWQAQFWKAFSEIAQKDLLDEMIPEICALITDTSDSSNQILASEAFAGIVRGSKRWPFEMQKKLWPEATKVLDLVVKESPVTKSGNWAAAMTFISFHRDPRRLHWATDWLIENLAFITMEESSTSPEQSKCISLITRVFKSLNWKANSFSGNS